MDAKIRQKTEMTRKTCVFFLFRFTDALFATFVNVIIRRINCNIFVSLMLLFVNVFVSFWKKHTVLLT